MKKPNLFLVGCPRCGTTTLYQLLNSHPEIYMSPVKGPNYFGEYPNRSFPRHHKNKKKYLSLYKNRKEKWLGDASHYFISKTAPKRIKKFNPNSKILIILRKPIDMVISHYKMGLISNDKKLKESLEERENEQVGFLKKRLNYTENVKRYLNVFGKENVKIILFSELKKNPNKIKKGVGDFLRINRDSFGEIYQSNPSKELKREWLKNIVISFHPKLRIFIKNLFPKKILGKMQKKLWDFSLGKEIKFDKKEIPKTLIEKNNLETKKLNKIIKENISHWIVK